MYVYTYIYIYIYIVVWLSGSCEGPAGPAQGAESVENGAAPVLMGIGKDGHDFRGNHLSNTTCLTQVFFKSGEACSKL